MDFTHVQKLLDTALSDYGIPCSDVAITHNGKMVYRYFNGTSDDEQKVCVRGDELYYLYSATKPITCAAALQLVEQGKLMLEAKLSDYIPEYENMMVRTECGLETARNPITIKHLFTMTSGMNYNLKSDSIVACLKNNPMATTLDLVRAMAQEPLDFEPGTHFQYGLNHDVLGAVIEVVSNMSLGDYFQKNIFDVCGMHNTGFGINEDVRSRMCSQYRYVAETGKTELIEKKNEFVPSPAYHSGGAGLISCVDDYLKFATELANGNRLLKKETIDLMRANHLDRQQHHDFQDIKPGYSYGLGVRTAINSSFASKEEFGWDGAAGAYVLIDPVEHIAVFYATHIRDCVDFLNQTIMQQLREIVYHVIKASVSNGQE